MRNWTIFLLSGFFCVILERLTNSLNNHIHCIDVISPKCASKYAFWDDLSDCLKSYTACTYGASPLCEWENESSNCHSSWTLCCTAHKYILLLQHGFSCDEQGLACLQMPWGTGYKVFVWPFSIITSSLSGFLAITGWSSQNTFNSIGPLSLSQCIFKSSYNWSK